MSVLLTLVLAVLGFTLFILGLRLMTLTFQAWTGPRLRSFLARYTSRPVVAMTSGLVVAAVLQSSSATNIMVVGLLGAGLLDLPAAFAVILGANIGTTLTAHLVTLPFGHLGPQLLLVGSLLGWPDPRRFALAYPARVIAAVGAIFYGLNLVTAAFGPLLSADEVAAWVGTLAHSPILAVGIGTLITSIVQSSSLLTAIAVGLASKGLILSGVAIALVLGSNIGTVFTTILASLWANAEARRAAIADLLFNLVGVLLVLPFLSTFVQLVSLTSLDPGRQVANAHTLFNLVTAVATLPWIGPICRSIQRLTRRFER